MITPLRGRKQEARKAVEDAWINGIKNDNPVKGTETIFKGYSGS